MNSNEEMNAELTPVVEDDAIEPQGFIDRVINIYIDPHTLFKYLAIKPDFWTPWIVVGLLMVLMTALTFPVTYDWGVEQQIKAMEEDGADDDKIADVFMAAEKFKTVSMIIYVVLSAVAPLIGWLITGGIVFLISLIQGLDAAFKRVFSVVAYCSMISILGATVIGQIIKLAKGAETLAEWERSFISLAVLLPANAHKALVYALGILDPFFIWSLIVMVIGLMFANKCRMRSAIVTVIIYAVIIILLTAGWGFVQELLNPGTSGGGGARVTVSA